MDAIQTYRGYPAVPSPLRAAPAALAVNPAAVKTTSNYLRALRRRIWMVLAVAVPLAVLGCIYSLRLPSVFRAKAEIEINAPDYDPVLSTLVSHDIGRRDPGNQERYPLTRAGRLKNTRLQEKVVAARDLGADLSQFEDPVADLFASLTFLPLQKGGNTFFVTLEGGDPFRTKRLLEVLLREFADEAKEETRKKMDDSEKLATDNVKELKKELDALDLRIKNKILSTNTLGAGGKSIIEERYISQGTMLGQKQLKLGELSQQMMLMEHFPRLDQGPEAARKASLIATLEMERRRITEFMRITKNTARHFNSDAGAMMASRKLEAIMDELDELKNARLDVGLTPTEMMLEQMQRDFDADKEEQARLLREMRESLPAHQEVLDMIEDRKAKAKRIADMEVKIAEFKILANTPSITEFVTVPSSVPEPAVPIKPNRALLIVASVFLSLAAGIGLVCLLEHIDHSVKVPEHASHGLTLPLLGVVPRIRRTALTQRGGHLWTSGASDALACDAYRNVRASLLGVADRRGPIVTLLVTSAKAGEGKSTTALNLAATCALAGERTLLLDIDLRRPSLADVFVDDEDPHPVVGVADVLKGEVPWQRTLRHTRIPNLDFIATGDTRDTPIEILGSLELRQLVLALSHHYDRVILDGPAVLGLADCRFLGRIVDSSLLVVRSGSHHLNTLHRAKAMLEQSHVAIAGVVFNGLTEDIENWSSYYGEHGAVGRRPSGSKPRRRTRKPCGDRRPGVIYREVPIVELQQKIMTATDRVLAVALVALVLGSGLFFGGAVWWFPPALVILVFLMATSRLVQCAVQGRMSILKSPMTLLGLLALALGVAQSLPLPAALARRVSPAAHEVWATGTWSRLVQADDPEAEPIPAAPVRSPATLDRAATLHWLVRAAACLAIFWTASHFVDRRRRLFWLLGSVVSVFVLNAAVGIVQLGGGSEGMFGFMMPGRGPTWGPTLDDLLESPAPAALRRMNEPARDPRPAIETIASVPERPFLLGTMMGGPGALLAMGSMALPVGLAILLHVLSPRGSREGLADRLGHSGLGSLAVLLVILLASGRSCPA